MNMNMNKIMSEKDETKHHVMKLMKLMKLKYKYTHRCIDTDLPGPKLPVLELVALPDPSVVPVVSNVYEDDLLQHDKDGPEEARNLEVTVAVEDGRGD